MSTVKLKRSLPLFLIIILIGIVWVSGILDYIDLDFIKSQRNELLLLVNDRPILSTLGFFTIYIFAVALSLPIATLLTLLGGFLFGRWLGTLIVVFSATIGALILFLAARSAIGQTLRDKAGPLYNKVQSNMQSNAVGYMLFMRLVPIFPFFLVNIVPALFNIRVMPYVLTTFAGIIPGTFVYVNLGRQLGSIELLSDLVSPATLGSFALLGLFALIPTLYRQLRRRHVTSEV
jgi:uncharacterized membrane protein YdjX (TVP38/TMEM64 family)